MLPKTVNKIFFWSGVFLVAFTLFVNVVMTDIIFGYYNYSYAIQNALVSPVSIVGYALIAFAVIRNRVMDY